MRVALDAYRISTEAAFRRDQAHAITNVIDKLSEILAAIASEKGCSDHKIVADQVLRRIHVSIVDLDENSPLEQATLLILAAQGYWSPALFWAKLISDCLTHSTRRHTISIATEQEGYARFVRSEGITDLGQAENFFQIEFGNFEFSVGREVLLGTMSVEGELSNYVEGELSDYNDKLVLMEFRRFDEDCIERLHFEHGQCHLKNGIVIDVICRTATLTGMERFIERHNEILDGKELIHFSINSVQDLETGICADLHREKVRDEILKIGSELICLRCGEHISSISVEVVELEDSPLRVGIVHNNCLKPLDRLLGTIQNDFFESNSFLVNFDVAGWFRAIERGQGVFASGLHDNPEAVIAWGGRKPNFAPGNFLVEFLLANGESEYCFERGKIHRFTRIEAEQFAETMNAGVATALADNDPLCFSDQSRAFGRRSELTKLLGVKENLREMTRARVVRFDKSIADRYELWRNWYAPLLLLQNADDGRVIAISNVIPIITNPLDLDKYIENWHTAGVDFESYKTTIIYSDQEFDDFMSEAEADGMFTIVNPLLEPEGKGGITRGTLEQIHLNRSYTRMRRSNFDIRSA